MLATNLYRILGKKTYSDKSIFKNKTSEDDLKETIFSDEVLDYSQKQILELDKSFDFNEFLEGAKEAFKIIVEAYNTNKLESVKFLVSKDVYERFNRAIDKTNKTEKEFNIVSVKASISNIEVTNEQAEIKVEFISNQIEKVSNKTNKLNNIKDIWTFMKNMNNDTVVWKLVEVGIE